MPIELAKSTKIAVSRIASVFSRLFLRDRCGAVTVPSLITAEDAPGVLRLVRLPPGPQHPLARVRAAKAYTVTAAQSRTHRESEPICRYF
jgi:hypothetical protein